MRSTSGEPIPTQQDARGLGFGAGAILAGLVGSRACRLLTRIGIARFLGAASLGIFDLAWTIVFLLSFVAPLGLHAAIVRFGAAMWETERSAFRALVWSSLRLTLVVGSAAAVALLVFAAALNRWVFQHDGLVEGLRVLALLIPFAAGLQVLTAATQAMQRMRDTAILRELLAPLVQLLLFLAAVAAGFGLAGALGATVLGFVTAFCVAVVRVRRYLETPVSPTESVMPWSTLLGFSLPVAGAGVINAFLFLADRLVVGAMRPPEDLGVYSATAQLSILLAVALSALKTTLAPRFVLLRDRGERRRVERLFRLSTRWGILLVAPAVAVLLVSPQAVLVGVFGSEFGFGASALRVLVLGQLVNVVTGPVGVVLVNGGHERVWLLLGGVSLALNVVLDIALLPVLGILGAAWGSAVALTCLFGGAAVAAYRLYGLVPFDARSWRLAPVVLAALGGALLVARLSEAGPLWTLVLSCLISGGAAAVALAAIGLEAEDRETLRGLWDRLRRKG